jgi:hypothetical protein
MGMSPGAWGYDLLPGLVSESDLLRVGPVEIRIQVQLLGGPI